MKRITIKDNCVIKMTDKHEYEMYKVIENLNLCPKLLGYNQKEDNSVELIMEKYPFTFSDVPMDKRKLYYSYIQSMVQILHRNNILHGDLHTMNIVLKNKEHEQQKKLIIDPEKNDIKFIDFENSEYIDTIDEECRKYIKM